MNKRKRRVLKVHRKKEAKRKAKLKAAKASAQS
jgi:hypothetical protein